MTATAHEDDTVIRPSRLRAPSLAGCFLVCSWRDASVRGCSTLSIRLPAEVEDRLDALARQTGRTKGSYARQAILEKIVEEIYLAETTLERLRAVQERVTDAEEMRRDLADCICRKRPKIRARA